MAKKQKTFTTLVRSADGKTWYAVGSEATLSEALEVADRFMVFYPDQPAIVVEHTAGDRLRHCVTPDFVHYYTTDAAVKTGKPEVSLTSYTIHNPKNLPL